VRGAFAILTGLDNRDHSPLFAAYRDELAVRLRAELPLGQSEPETIGAGEYCYVDGSGEVLCRLEHRQCERTKVTVDTTSAFYIIQGNANTSHDMLEQALRRLVELTQRFCHGHEDQFWIVD
jgi:DNA/RNA-binding domain of Phe-tRNA-synthetase-like protein